MNGKPFPCSRRSRLLPGLAITLLSGSGSSAASGIKVRVFPDIQFVREGCGVLLKAQAKGNQGPAAWKWEIRDPVGGRLDSISVGRIQFTADGVAPWSTVRVRATSIEDPSAFGEGVVEVLPSAVFGVLEHVLGRYWLDDRHCRPDTIRMEVIEPGFLSWSGTYTIQAEIASVEIDRFTWDVEPRIGTLVRKETDDPGRDTVAFTPPGNRKRGVFVTITARNLENPGFRFSTEFYVPPSFWYASSPSFQRERVFGPFPRSLAGVLP